MFSCEHEEHAVHLLVALRTVGLVRVETVHHTVFLLTAANAAAERTSQRQTNTSAAIPGIDWSWASRYAEMSTVATHNSQEKRSAADCPRNQSRHHYNSRLLGESFPCWRRENKLALPNLLLRFALGSLAPRSLAALPCDSNCAGGSAASRTRFEATNFAG